MRINHSRRACRSTMSTRFALADLEAFRAVAELGHFGRAAERVHLSQPAFSRRIDKLEQALSVKLLERSTRRVALTAVGREFLRKVQGVLDELDSTLLGIRGVATSRLGEVTVACVPSTVYYAASGVIQAFRANYPRTRVKILDAGANEVLAAVARGDADFGLNFIGSQEHGIEFKTLLEERFVLACRRDHVLARKRRVAWGQLAEHDVVAVAQSSGNRLLLDQALAGLNLQLRTVCEAQHVTTMLGLVEAGLGVAAVPAMAMPGKEHPLLISVPLDTPVVTRRMGLIRRAGRTLPPAAQPLYDAFAALARPRRKPRVPPPLPSFKRDGGRGLG
jgi:DNA-binding transcriptional LysR family regulator